MQGIRLALRGEHGGTPPGPPDGRRRLVPDERELVEPHARRRDPDLRGAAAQLRRPGRAHPRPPLAGAALPPEAGGAATGGRAAALGRRRQLQPDLPHPPHRAARAGRRGAAETARRAGLLAAARPLEAALGAVARPGPGARPLRDPDQDPPRDGRRDLRRRHRHRPLRPRAGARAGGSQRRLGAAGRAGDDRAGRPRDQRRGRDRRSRPPSGRSTRCGSRRRRRAGRSRRWRG